MNKKILLILCAIFLLCFLLCACGGDGNTDTETSTETNTETETNKDTSSNEIDYTVKVVDYKGEPISTGLFVQFYKDGKAFDSMKKADANGTVVFKMEKADYTFEVIYTDSETLTYDKEGCTLTAQNPSKEIVLYNMPSEDTIKIFPYDSKKGDTYEYEAVVISEGATKATIDGMTYYVFRATRGGVYKFSYICDVAINIGFYGMSANVLRENTAEIENRAFQLEIKDSSASTPGGEIVIGIKSLATDNCILTVERISDASKPIQRLEYPASEVPSSKVNYNYLNGDIVDLDIKNPNLEVVYNEDDGYYHLGTLDGDIVLVRISTPSKYIASFKEMCDVTKLFKIFTDENGTPLREETYNEMITKYAEKCDNAGVVPLTKELAYAIQNILEQQGWYGNNNIFKEKETVDDQGNIIEGEKISIPEKNAWLFPCCILKENDKGALDKKIVVEDTLDPKPAIVIMDGEETLYFKAKNQVKATFFIEDAKDVKVLVNGAEHIANENGVIEIIFEALDGAIEFEIVNISKTSQEIEFTYVTYVG